MAILPSIIEKILSEETDPNKPVSSAIAQKMGKNINALIDGFNQGQLFTTNGTFIVPDNVTRILAFGCGGGGGGGKGYNLLVGFTSYRGGGAGGNGAVPYPELAFVTPSSSIPITIGAGGVGATVNPNSASAFGGNGGNTTVGSLLTFRGALGGYSARIVPFDGGTGPINYAVPAQLRHEANSGYYCLGGADNRQAAFPLAEFFPQIVTLNSYGLTTSISGSSAYAAGGVAGANLAASFSGGGGGGAGYGPGGNGGNGSGSINGASALATSYGAGGGGGGCGSTSGVGGNGGNGAPGFLFILW